MLSARMTPPPAVDLPLLPPEILRRVIRHALALPPSVPRRFPADVDLPGNNASKTLSAVAPVVPFPADPEWDVFAARAARKALNQRAAAREGVTRTARNLMGVCRAWKVSTLVAAGKERGRGAKRRGHERVANKDTTVSWFESPHVHPLQPCLGPALEPQADNSATTCDIAIARLLLFCFMVRKPRSQSRSTSRLAYACRALQCRMGSCVGYGSPM
jgi:hypothetical protein